MKTLILSLRLAWVVNWAPMRASRIDSRIRSQVYRTSLWICFSGQYNQAYLQTLENELVPYILQTPRANQNLHRAASLPNPTSYLWSFHISISYRLAWLPAREESPYLDKSANSRCTPCRPFETTRSPCESTYWRTSQSPLSSFLFWNRCVGLFWNL